MTKKFVAKKLAITSIMAIITIPLIFPGYNKASNTEVINEILNDNMTIEEMSTDNSSISTMALYPDRPEISERTYYIKNMATGQYLDVSGRCCGRWH